MPRLSNGPKFKFTRQIFFGLAIVFIFVAGYILGQTVTENREKLNLGQFWRVYGVIEKSYVGSIDQSKAIEGAIKGLVESLGDPFSSFLPANEKQQLEEELSGEFEGIGAELTEKDGLITVVTPLDESPASKAGLKAKDVIVKIDDESTESMSVNDAVTKIRGRKGTTVKLEVAREGESKILELNITRAAIQIKSVKSKTLAENIGYVEVNQFGDDTVSLFEAAIKDLSKQGVKALVIDLRNNPGGYLSTVAPITGQFIAPNVIVKEKFKDGRTEELRSTTIPTMPNIPLYVLVNAGSASASEIVAGALQDYERATIVGQKTFGKGSVQELIPVSNGDALRLTTAEWLTPKNRQINGKGIEPNVVVDGEKTDTSDPVLDKVLELISKL